MSFKNAQDSGLARELVSWDTPQQLTLSGMYEFPVGPRKRFVNQGQASHIIGGWQFNWNLALQSGTPLALPGGYTLKGDPKLTTGQTLSHWFNTDKSIWVVQTPDTLRTMPFRSPNIRNPGAPNVDVTLIREFRIREGHTFQVRASAFNTTNSALFGGPNTSPSSNQFGVVTLSQANLPRSIEVVLRYSF